MWARGLAAEGANDESLDQTEAIIRAGKHCWYDKPPGEDWGQWQRVVALATVTARKERRRAKSGAVAELCPTSAPMWRPGSLIGISEAPAPWGRRR